ncbi:MAG: toxin-antitoxin system YwqK family antitoxin, partial [Aeoliella sp.]
LKTEEMYLAPKTVQTSPDIFWNAEFAQYGSEGEALLHGVSKAWYANGQIQTQGEYSYDKRVGNFQYWHANGQLAAEGKYKDDQYDGQWLWWHENGQKAIVGQYRDGQLIGEWRWWNELGKLANRKYYDGTESVSTQDATEETEKVGKSTPDIELIR